MSFSVLGDRAHETSLSIGTGNITLLGAEAACQSLHAAVGLTTQTDYAIVSRTGGQWEVGRGQLSDNTTLVRTTVVKGSNGTSHVDFGAGTKDVYVGLSSATVAQIITAIAAAQTAADDATAAAAAAQATANAALPTAGGEMSGPIDMGHNHIQGLTFVSVVRADVPENVCTVSFNGDASCTVYLPNTGGLLALASEIPDVSAYLPLAGGTMGGVIDMALNGISRVGTLTIDNGGGNSLILVAPMTGFEVSLLWPDHGGTLALTADFLPLTGGTMAGDIDLASSFNINNALSISVTTLDVATLSIGPGIAVTNVSGSLDFSNCNITNVSNFNAGASYSVSGTQVVGAQQSAIPDCDIGDLSSVGNTLNAVLSAIRAGSGHGLIGSGA